MRHVRSVLSLPGRMISASLIQRPHGPARRGKLRVRKPFLLHGYSPSKRLPTTTGNLHWWERTYSRESLPLPKKWKELKLSDHPHITSKPKRLLTILTCGDDAGPPALSTWPHYSWLSLA